MNSKHNVLVCLAMVIILLTSCGPGQVFGPTITPTSTYTSTPTITLTSTPTATLTPKPTSTFTPTVLPTNTPTSTEIPIPTKSIACLDVQMIKLEFRFNCNPNIIGPVDVSFIYQMCKGTMTQAATKFRISELPESMQKTVADTIDSYIELITRNKNCGSGSTCWDTVNDSYNQTLESLESVETEVCP
ncbi:MAG: hypothetical protein AB1894_23060 [Chloroflexota bacterium]